MKKDFISLSYKGVGHKVPNSWELLTPAQYLKLVNYLMRMDRGDLSLDEVRIYFLCDLMGWDVRKFRTDESVENLLAISEQLTFIFRKVYPVSDDKEKESEEYSYAIDLCFCRQLIPEVYVGKKCFEGYKVSTDFQSLTCSLTALQYIEARQLLDMGEASLPLMAAILYYPGEYSSEGAQQLAHQFEVLPEATLQAISLNFQAVNNFIFLKTEFSLLTKFVAKKGNTITTDAIDALYDLSKDGLGNVDQVERMNVLTYLRILRKKTIDGVKSLKASGMDVVKISNEVGLPLQIVKQIV